MAKRRYPRYPDARATPLKTVGYGYVGSWRDGSVGWFLPTHLGGTKNQSEPPAHAAGEHSRDDDYFTLCRITVEVLPFSRRRRHPRRVKR